MIPYTITTMSSILNFHKKKIDYQVLKLPTGASSGVLNPGRNKL
jgi:hypothetical protein